MKTHHNRRAISWRILPATLTLLLSTLPFHAAKADPKDYEFRLVETAIKQGDGAVIAVKLIDKRSGKPVPDAVIFATRIDMAPDGMEMMASKIEPRPSTEPGTYRFTAPIASRPIFPWKAAGGFRSVRRCRVRLARSRASSFSRP